MNVLIIDDEYYTRKALAKIIGEIFGELCPQNFEIIEFSNAEEVLEQIGKLPMDVVFTDIRMSTMDGIDLCQRLNTYNPNISLVIISGYAEFSYAQRAMKCNVIGYLTKPVDEGEIREVVQAIFQKRKAITAAMAQPSSIRTEPAQRTDPLLDLFTKKLIHHYLSEQKPGQIKDVMVKYLSTAIENHTITDKDCSALVLEFCSTINDYMRQFFQTPDSSLLIDTAVVKAVTDFPSATAFISQLSDQILSLISCQKRKERTLAEDITSYIQENYYENLTLYDLATKKYFIHPNYLSKVLKDHTGLSFSKYLLEVRMKNALKLLERDDLNVSTIAQLSGYNSESHFVQMFKKYYGYTPGIAKKNRSDP